MKDVNTRKRLIFLFPNLDKTFRVQLQKNWPTFDTEVTGDGIIAKKPKKWEFTLCVTFSLPWPL